MKEMGHKDWESFWSGTGKVLNKISGKVMWVEYERFLKYVNLSVHSKTLELGSGSGKNSLALAKKYGCSATLVDNCRAALDLGKKNFEDESIPARFLLKDIFRLNEKEKYDLVFSDGLIEHFSGKRRRYAFKKHVDAAKKGGYIMIFVPKSNALYWIVRTFLKKIGAWMFTEEPSTEKELAALCDEHDLKVIKMQTWLTDLGVLAIKTKG